MFGCRAAVYYVLSSFFLHFTSTDNTDLRHLQDEDVFSCSERTFRMRSNNYLRYLLFFRQCLDKCDSPSYDYGYCDAVRRNVAGSCREFVGRRKVLPAVRRLVYDTANLYLQRIGRVVYEHEMALVDRKRTGCSHDTDTATIVNPSSLPMVFCPLCVLFNLRISI